jgi:hypothetical protein
MVWYQYNKYYSTKKVKSGGRSYDSKFEAGYGQELEMRKKAGEIKDYETHKPMDLISNGYKIGTYYIDFIVYHNDDTLEYVETKGFPTELWKYKWKIFCSMYEDDPNIKLSLIMQKNFKMHKIKKYGKANPIR